MAACPSCGTRKGKRSCPALRAPICSVCCGQKRVVEIACPADCVWLGRGTQNDFERSLGDYLRHQEPAKARRYYDALASLGPYLEAIEGIVARAAPAFLTDGELLRALEAARKTFEHEARGVIYEETPASPTLLVVAREISKGASALAEELRQRIAQAGGGPTPGPAETAECLAVLEDRCAYHESRKGEGGAFLQVLRRLHPPRPSARVDDAPRIVLG